MLQKALAEMTGTFAMIFVGMGSILLSEKFPQNFPVAGIPIAWGPTIALMILVFGSLSGAHFNPAVTLVFAAAKRLPAAHIPIYWASQFMGGLTAFGLLEILKKI